MASLKGGVKDRIVHEIGRAIKQAQIEWCGVGCVRACTGRWLVLSLDAALLHGLHSLSRGYWPAVSLLLDKPSLSMLSKLPYATKPISKGRSWLCLCISEGQLEGYLHALSSNQGLLESYYGPHALLRDAHRTHILLMLVAGLEHLKMAIPMDIPGWIQPGGSVGSSSSTSVASMNISTTSMDSSLPSPSQHEPFDVDLTCSEAIEESWHSIEGDLPVSHSVCEDLDTHIEIEHIPKRSRRKKQSRSSSRSSSRAASGSTTPTDSIYAMKMNSTVEYPSSKVYERTECESEETIPYDNRIDTAHNGRVSQSVCDNCEENVIKSKRTIDENFKFKERLLQEVDQETRMYETWKDELNSACNLNKMTSQEKIYEDCGVVTRRGTLPSAKNIDKRVSFTESSSTALQQKPIHNRLSLCGDLSKGAEIRDLSDLRDLLSNLKDQGLLPSTLALEELFTTLDQTSPVMSERAPPEGQEDPPLHQSIISLTSNNNSINDDNKNNNDSKDDVPKNDTADNKLETDEKRRLDIIGGVRWEELTKIGKEMIADGGVAEEERGQEPSATGARPKQRLGCEFNKTQSATSATPRLGHDPTLTRNKYRERKEKRNIISLADRRRLYKECFRKERKLPNLYIPMKVDVSKFVEEEHRLNLEIVQGQSNIVMAGHTVDPMNQEELRKRLFISSDEKFYKLFSVREGHSNGSSVSVQIVLSTQALYVVTPVPKWSKPRHIVPYHDIHTIIVGFNDQWICILNKTAVLDDLATTGTNSGVQLEIGDPEVTHSLVSCLEVAMRRHFSALKLSRDEQTTSKPFTPCKIFPQARSSPLSKECADNFSNSILERSQLTSHGSKQVSLDISMESPDTSQLDSPAITPGSLSCSQDSPVASEVSLISETSRDMSEASLDSSQKSSDISHIDTENSQSSVDISQDISDLSQSSSVSHDSEDTCTSETVSSPVEVHPDPSYDVSHDEDDPSKAQAKLQEKYPIQLHLEKQYGMQRYAGGYCRWNGTVLDRSLPAVMVHPAWELAGLRKWLRAQLRLQSDPEVVGSWLVDWEDGSSLGGGEASGPLGPAIEGPLMFKPPGILMSWKAAYFILKAGVLYQFNDAHERLPHMIEEVSKCVGCVRIGTNHRPHAFQLLRKNAAPIMLAASDEHEASLWLQAFLTVINSGVRDLSERRQVSCKIILIKSGVLLAQQSDMILGIPLDLSHNITEEKASESLNSVATHLSQEYLSVSPNALSPGQLVKKDTHRLVNPTLSNLRDRKPLSSSLTNLHRTNSSSSIPCSPIRRISNGEKISSQNKNAQNRKGSLTRLYDAGYTDVTEVEIEKNLSINAAKDSKPKIGEGAHNRSRIMEPFMGKGEMKVLTHSALEQLSSVSVYAECPNTCLLEFECSEAGEISGDWALYFRCGGQMQSFVKALARTWRSIYEMEFPLHTVDDLGVQQFLLEGSQISSSGWSTQV
ncbi:hypothetical protein SK128_015989 [Halocaridina rubra]|uniref:PH domain-containing protein n=1 Tax=Halocaridina rubra TaxID=373956 RepID=A0AAN9A3M8_HALRR